MLSKVSRTSMSSRVRAPDGSTSRWGRRRAPYCRRLLARALLANRPRGVASMRVLPCCNVRDSDEQADAISDRSAGGEELWFSAVLRWMWGRRVVRRVLPGP
jgi:hypothetical protein